MNSGFRLFCTVLAFLLCSLSAVEAAPPTERSVIIGFRQAPGAAEQALVAGKKGRINRKFRHLSAITATLPEADIEALRNNSNVAYVAENTIYAVAETLPGTELQNSWQVEQIGAQAAHTASIFGAGIKVAVLDTGIDTTHPELVDAYKGGIDIAANDADPTDESTNSHGTHVAGIIAGARNDSGIVGIAPGVSLYAVKVFNGGLGTIEHLIAGIDWAIENQMDIINLSNGIGSDENAAVTDAMARAEAAGILVVAAAGNSIGPVSFPAATPSVVAVTSTDRNKQIANFAPSGAQIDLAAPGIDITSTVVGGYDTLSGSSMAAPQVTGVAALLLSNGLTDSNGNGSKLDELKAQLFGTAEDLGAPCKDTVFGYGLVNAARALGLEALPTAINCSGLGDPVAAVTLTRQARHSEDDAQEATLSGGKYAITVLNNGLRSITVKVYKNEVFVQDLSGTLTFNRKTAKGVTLPFDATAGPYQVVFLPTGKFGASATLLFNAPDSALPGAVKGINRKYKHLP